MEKSLLAFAADSQLADFLSQLFRRLQQLPVLLLLHHVLVLDGIEVLHIGTLATLHVQGLRHDGLHPCHVGRLQVEALALVVGPVEDEVGVVVGNPLPALFMSLVTVGMDGNGVDAEILLEPFG